MKFFLTALLLLAAAVSVTGKAFAEPLPPDVARQLEIEADAQRAYEAIMQDFGTNSDGMYEYPDYYGGSYMEDGILYVNLTAREQEIRDHLLEVCGAYSNVVQFRDVSYAMHDLLSLSEEISQETGIVSTCVNERENRVDAAVDPAQNISSTRLFSDPARADMVSIKPAEGEFYFFDAYGRAAP